MRKMKKLKLHKARKDDSSSSDDAVVACLANDCIMDFKQNRYLQGREWLESHGFSATMMATDFNETLLGWKRRFNITVSMGEVSDNLDFIMKVMFMGDEFMVMCRPEDFVGICDNVHYILMCNAYLLEHDENIVKLLYYPVATHIAYELTRSIVGINECHLDAEQAVQQKLQNIFDGIEKAKDAFRKKTSDIAKFMKKREE